MQSCIDTSPPKRYPHLARENDAKRRVTERTQAAEHARREVIMQQKLREMKPLRDR